MIGLDTNVLVRYIVRDDPKQTAAATALIEQRCTPDSPGWISVIVICELAWVLRRVYSATREDIAAILETLLTSNELKVETADLVWQGLRMFRKGSADMADHLIGLSNGCHGASRTFTFDQRAALDPNFHLIET